ncbi:MAG: bifunctional diguanylate cyclase/phosphodiesterase [Litoreibacter sp.]|nr:bifunctional diguanylate cyclase/phosphodiesterase [Litoreibacter sp.]
MGTIKSNSVSTQKAAANNMCSAATHENVWVAPNRLETAFWIYDIDNQRIPFANASALELWQAESQDQLFNRDLGADMSTTVAERLRQYQSDFESSDAVFRELWTLYPGGVPTSLMVTFRGYRLQDGRMAMQCEVGSDVEDEPESLRSAEALLHTDVMISLYERDSAPFYMNPAARAAVQFSKQKLEDRFLHSSDYRILTKKLERVGEHRMIAKVNTKLGVKWHDISAKLCTDAYTGRPSVLITEIDVSELKNARDRARYLAESDQLTGCFNRSYLLQHISMLQKFQTDECALISFDIDKFKQINDRFGHEMGDVVLQEISGRIRASVREDDIVVRLGGDEFLVVLERYREREALEKTIRRIRDVIAKPIVHDERRVNTSISMGITVFHPRTADFTEVMREADIALYASKQAGRDRATFFDEKISREASARAKLEAELRDELEKEEFELFFQPRIELESGRIVSAEALVRWPHPTRGMVSPGEFIPVCEETGMIEELGQLILKKGCSYAMEWNKMGLDLQLSINISPRQFSNPGLMRELDRISRHPLFEKGIIELEITESVLVGDLDEIEAKLQTITKMGYGIAIDDFGTGYSSLSYITRFPLSCLKIDQSFIGQLPRSGPVMELILTLAKQIGATVVSEGVETKGQLEWLAKRDCDQVQGFYFARPVPQETFLHMLDDRPFEQKYIPKSA